MDHQLWHRGTDNVCLYVYKSVYCLLNLRIKFFVWQWDGTLGRWTYSSQMKLDMEDEDVNIIFPSDQGFRHLRRSRRIALQRERQQKSQDALEQKRTTSCWLVWLVSHIRLMEDKCLLMNRMMYLTVNVSVEMRVVTLLLLPVLSECS